MQQPTDRIFADKDDSGQHYHIQSINPGWLFHICPYQLNVKPTYDSCQCITGPGPGYFGGVEGEEKERGTKRGRASPFLATPDIAHYTTNWNTTGSSSLYISIQSQARTHAHSHTLSALDYLSTHGEAIHPSIQLNSISSRLLHRFPLTHLHTHIQPFSSFSFLPLFLLRRRRQR